MEYNNTIDAVLSDIKGIENIVKRFKENESIPKIELDLALEKIRKLYDILLMLEDSTIETEIVEPVKQKKVDIEEELESKLESIEPDVNVTDDSINSYEEYENEDVILEETSDDLKKQEPEYELEPMEETVSTVSDKFQNTQYRNESIGEKSSKTVVSSKLQSIPIADINKAIGINDKFLFTKELFNSNPKAYKQTIDELNKAESYTFALNYLESTFDWDFESDVVTDFIDIIKRKFPDD